MLVTVESLPTTFIGSGKDVRACGSGSSLTVSIHGLQIKISYSTVAGRASFQGVFENEGSLDRRNNASHVGTAWLLRGRFKLYSGCLLSSFLLCCHLHPLNHVFDQRLFEALLEYDFGRNSISDRLPWIVLSGRFNTYVPERAIASKEAEKSIREVSTTLRSR